MAHILDFLLCLYPLCPVVISILSYRSIPVPHFAYTIYIDFVFVCLFLSLLSPTHAKRSGGYGNAGRPSVLPSEMCCKRSEIFICWPIDFKPTHKSIILGISSLTSKLGKIRKQIVRMAAIFKMSAKTHQNFKVLQFQRKLIFRRFSTWGMW